MVRRPESFPDALELNRQGKVGGEDKKRVRSWKRENLVSHRFLFYSVHTSARVRLQTDKMHLLLRVTLNKVRKH